MGESTGVPNGACPRLRRPTVANKGLTGVDERPVWLLSMAEAKVRALAPRVCARSTLRSAGEARGSVAVMCELCGGSVWRSAGGGAQEYVCAHVQAQGRTSRTL